MCSLIDILQWKKKIQKDSDDCWHRKLTLKVKFWYFLTAPHYSNFQNFVISFEYSWFLAKNLSNFVSLHWKLHNRECHTQHSWYLTCHCLICTRLKSDTFEIYKRYFEWLCGKPLPFIYSKRPVFITVFPRIVSVENILFWQWKMWKFHIVSPLWQFLLHE